MLYVGLLCLFLPAGGIRATFSLALILSQEESGTGSGSPMACTATLTTSTRGSNMSSKMALLPRRVCRAAVSDGYKRKLILNMLYFQGP